MRFDDLVDAVRTADGDDPDLAVVTQLRLRRSLEVRARSRHQFAGLATAVAILFGGTVSWALATGQATALWAPAPLQTPAVAPAPAPEPPAPAPVPPRRAHPRNPAPAVPGAESAVEPALDPAADPAAEPEPGAVVDAVTGPDLALVTAPRPVPPPLPDTVVPAPPVRERGKPPVPPAPPPMPVDTRYRSAHELHFHGGDPAATLAAWDAYLAAEPDGRFSVEARYNRAIVLVRLGRYAEARAALAPFAHGEVEPEGYRQREAGQLMERLARYE